MKLKQIHLGIRTKVTIASVIIALMLFLSGVVAYWEFARMNNYVSQTISNNISSVNITRSLVGICDEYQASIFQKLGSMDIYDMPELKADSRNELFFKNLRAHLTTDDEKRMADSVRYAYATYMQVVLELEQVWFQSQTVRQDWYFNKLQDFYDEFRNYLMKLSELSQTALTDNYNNMNDSFYRSVMPGIVAAAVGILLLGLFNYFLNIYLLKPVSLMERALRHWKEFGKPYNTSINETRDELSSLNAMITDLTSENTSLKNSKKLKQ
ncbi:MAG: hypothetical protein HUJ89_04070 [Bacteroidales bacterium]|nr:hypothetical protein [Bacteroidales bacterium]